MNAANRRGDYRENEPLSRYTSWAVGGPAERFYRPADVADLAQFIGSLSADEPLTFIGYGSNLLVRDGGQPGTTICLRGRLSELERLDATRVRAGAGVSCARLARQLADWGMVGGSFFAGIPGSLGGALAMNAGAHGGETWPLVRGVRTLDRAGQPHERARTHYQIGYRSVQPAVGQGEEWFVSAELQLKPDTEGVAMREIRELQAARAATQPIEMRSCGSVFRNPPGDHAARLIEASGLKGKKLGGAMVSPKHANFIVNADNAKAADIEALISTVLNTVRDQHGVDLIPEVRIIGVAA